MDVTAANQSHELGTVTPGHHSGCPGGNALKQLDKGEAWPNETLTHMGTSAFSFGWRLSPVT